MKKEKRLFKRFSTELRGVIILDEKRYIGKIMNVSEEGLCYLIYDYICNNNEISPEISAQLIFSNHFDNALSLDCNIVWCNAPSKDSSKSFLGMKVLHPPVIYKDYVRSLE